MSLLLDGIVLLIILLCFFVGWRRGAAITLLNFVALVAAFTVAVLLSPSLSNSIYETFFKSGVTEKISQSIGNSIGDGAEAVITGILSAIPSFAAVFLSGTSFDRGTISQWIENNNQESISSAATAVEGLISPAFTALIGIILMIILFFVLYAVFKALARLLSKFFELPVLSLINRVFGGVIGIAEGVILVMLVVSLVRMAMPLTGDSIPFLTQEAIDGSFLFKAFYTGDIINNIAGMFS